MNHPDPNYNRPPSVRDVVKVGFIFWLISILLVWGAGRACAEYVPYGYGCVTTVVIQPDGKRLICTTCPQANGVAVTICQ